MSEFHQQLAARLRFLKLRSDRSYAALAQRVGVSSSALHRYCTGEAVPPDFRVVERFGRVCGADRGELLNLHQLWLASVARRDRPRTDGLRPVRLLADRHRTRYLVGTAVATATIAVLSRWTRPRRRHA
jgi:transcriptional regulator with XRE-family HTH domain